jgi:hypothetical protein
MVRSYFHILTFNYPAYPAAVQPILAYCIHWSSFDILDTYMFEIASTCISICRCLR